ncbi:MAG: hypothetical protein P8Q87_01675, partial [Candidatus Poseidonia sp.]|nr:hypothetical protein [Poseidonia sp.]
MEGSNRITVCLVLCLILSGCISSAPVVEEGENTADEPPAVEAEAVPEWAATSHNGTQLSRTSMSQGPNIA